MKVNDNFEKLPESYLFSEVGRRIREFKEQNPGVEVVRMDIGDVTLPIAACVRDAMHRAVDDMGSKETFHGYGPEQGYLFLRDKIAEMDYQRRGIDIKADEIFISDGAKSDLGNLGDIYREDSVVAVTDPGYPVYLDTCVMSGRAGDLKAGRWDKILYLECTPATGFKPMVPEEHADVVILCSPSNPTGAVLTRDELKAWVEYARKEKALVIFDSAYEAFVADDALPRSIYEIEGAREVAIEVRSFSKTAGFTGLRCGYTVVPDSLYGFDKKGNKVSLRKLWLRRQTTKFNGASYIIQRGAEALYTPEGVQAVREGVEYYRRNAAILRVKLEQAGYEVFGGEHSPYVWARSPKGESSWELFSRLLEEHHVSCTPGVGFGDCGEGYIRFTGFNSREKTEGIEF